MLAIKDAMIDYNVDPDEYITFSLKVRQIANIVISEQYEEAERKSKMKAKG